MKKRLFKRVLTGLLLTATVVTFTGCMLYDDYSKCPPSHSITVRAFASATSDEEPLDESTVAEVALYVFDHNEKYLGVIQTKLDTPTTLNFPENNRFHIVALGNTADGDHSVNPTDGLGYSFLSLARATRGLAEFNSPADIFHGTSYFEIDSRYVNQRVEIPIYRVVGRMNITVRGLEKQPGDTDEDYQIVVNETHSAMDFNGNMLSDVDMAISKPSAVFLPNGDLFAENFNLFPNHPDTSITIDIYYKGLPIIQNISVDRDGEEIHIFPNGQSNVFIVLNNSDYSLVDLQIVSATWGNRIPIWIER